MKKLKHLYDRELNITTKNSADYFIVNSIYNKAKVLEIGFATGYVTKYLKCELECEVSGIEYNLEAFNKVKNHLKYGLNKDLNNINDWIDELPDNYFDFIICQDVLEHLQTPFNVLEKLSDKLSKKGLFLVSIPNASHNIMLMELLENKFTYCDVGFLDRTHIKFYTSESFNEEAKKIDLKLLNHFITYLVPEGENPNQKYLNFSPIQREVLLEHKNQHVFQNLFVLGKKDDFRESEEAKLFELNLENYDELYIAENDNKYKFYYEHGNEIAHKIVEDVECLEIYPSIRLIEYEIKLYINSKFYKIITLNLNDRQYNKNNNNFINLDNQKITIKEKFKKNDEIKIIVNSKRKLLENMNRDVTNVNKEMKKIKEMIDNNDVISFDIFDTLILRNVLFPKDIFKILGEYVEKKYEIKNFSQIRIEAEHQARIETDEEDILLDEIYNVLNKRLKIDVSSIKNEELRLEKEFIVVNPYMKEIYDYAVKNKKRILIISDMYLPKKIIENLIGDLGYTKYEQLLISGEVKKTKSTSTMYKFILDTKNIDKNSWLHIGDNYEADVSNPNNFGINTYYYKAVRDRANETDENISIKKSIMRALQYNKIYTGYDIPYWEKFGAEYISPIYYGFTDWIANININSDNIFFLARDGYIPYLVFNMLKEKRNLNGISSHYLPTSRKAFQLPSMAKISKDEFIELSTLWNASLGHNFTVSELFTNIGLNWEEYRHEIKMFNFKNGESIINHETRHEAKKLVSLIYEDAQKELLKKVELVKDFLIQEEMTKYDAINIVDIGWRGSIQYAIDLILCDSKKYILKGFYFGTAPYVHHKIKNDVVGYYFDFGIPHETFIKCDIMMYEFIFTAPQYQLYGFKNNGNKIEPVYGNDIENKEYVEIFQAAALEIVKEFLKYDEYLTGITSEETNEKYRQFIENKNYKDMIKFKEIKNKISYDTEEKVYTKEYSKKDVIKKFNAIIEDSNLNLWKGTFTIEGINTEEEFVKFIKEHQLDIKIKNNSLENNSFRRKIEKLLTLTNLKKGIKNPNLAIKKIMSIIKRMR